MVYALAAIMLALTSILTTILAFVFDLFSYRVKIGRVGWLYLRDVAITHTHTLKNKNNAKEEKTCIISASELSLTLHLPKLSELYWGIFTIREYERKDVDQHITISSIICTLHFFPVLIPVLLALFGKDVKRLSEGPLVSAELKDFRVLVHTSARWPNWIANLRDHLMYVILCTDILRLDHFKKRFVASSVRASAATEGWKAKRRSVTTNEAKSQSGSALNEEEDSDDDDDYESDSSDSGYTTQTPDQIQQTKKKLVPLEDEAVVSVTSSGWQIHNHYNHRLYVFGSIDAEMRKSWETEKGVFVMRATECEWFKLPRLESSTLCVSSFLSLSPFYSWCYITN